MPDRNITAAIGTIPCQLFWDGKTQGVFWLPAVPQVGTFILIEDPTYTLPLQTFIVDNVSMTALLLGEALMGALPEPPQCQSYVRVFLLPVGEAEQESKRS